MCLIVEKIPEDLKPLTAEKNITVYKVLLHRKDYTKCDKILHLPRIFTPYMMTPITFNFWGKCIMEANMDGKYSKKEDDVGNIYHIPKEHDIVWENGEIACNKAALTFDKGAYLSVYAGIHAYITRRDSQCNYSPLGVQEELHKAIIPKGAHYFIGVGNEIVADKMIIYRKTYGRKWNKKSNNCPY